MTNLGRLSREWRSTALVRRTPLLRHLERIVRVDYATRHRQRRKRNRLP